LIQPHRRPIERAAFTAGWAARLHTVFGAPLTEVDESHLQRLVDEGVREDADLDFKEALYGNGDSDRREFAADIASMANDRGGVIVIGIRDDNHAAVERTPVLLDRAEEGRMRAIGASNLAPYAPFEVLPVESSEHPGQGYYLVLVPPSPDRPHAVRKGIDLRYPRRHGSSKRWLAESEVADAYRDRFTRVGSDQDRLDTVLNQGREAMMPSEERPLFALALVPSQRGNLLIDAELVKRTEERVRQADFTAGRPPFEAPWAGLFAPVVLVGRRRLRIGTPGPDGGIDTHYTYAELHTDGSSFLGLQIGSPDPRTITGMMPAQATTEDRLILVTQLTILAVTCLRSAATLSSELGGAFGDCSVVAALIGNSMRLVRHDPDGRAVVTRGASQGPVFSPHTLTLDSLLELSPDLMVAARLLCSDLVQAFGEPELPGVSPEGALRVTSFPLAYQQQLRDWCDEHGVETRTT
jgi:hypothetical protein